MGKKHQIYLLGTAVSLVTASAVFIALKNRKSIVYKGPVAANFATVDHTGKFFELHRQNHAKAVVLISYGIGCPIVRKNIPTINDLSRAMAANGVRIFLLDSMLNDSRKNLQDEAEAFAIQVPILSDETQEIARMLEINRTGEALLIETGSWKILFRGPVDDRLGYGIEAASAKLKHLENALTQFLSQREVEPTRVSAPGCAITFAQPPSDLGYASVAKIMQAKCFGCHAQGEFAPTNLWTYEDLKGWGTMLKEVLLTERMPPWEVDGVVHPIQNDPALTAAEKRIIYKWIDSGFPRGELKLVPPLPVRSGDFASDLVLKMQKDIVVPARTSTPWHYEMILHNENEDLWISKFRFDISRPGVVQHAALLVMNSPMDLSANVFQPEFLHPKNLYMIMRALAEANRPSGLGPGLAYRIPKGSYVYLELHFAPTGKVENESVTVRLKKYAEANAPREVKYETISPKVAIPPNTETYTIGSQTKLDRDIYLIRLGAHMHWHGKAARVWVDRPNGAHELIFSQRYVFKNRRVYNFEPIWIGAGSVLKVEFDYDNSISNPAPIDPNRWVNFGPDALANEMFVMHYVYYLAEPHSVAIH